MSFNPNGIAELACVFYQELQTVRNSVSGAAIIEIVRDAAATSNSVTDAQYNQFIQYTAWRFSSWQQHYALTS